MTFFSRVIDVGAMPFDAPRTYGDFLLVSYCDCISVLYIFQDIVVYETAEGSRDLDHAPFRDKSIGIDSTVPPTVFGWSSVRGGGREDDSTEFGVGR